MELQINLWVIISTFIMLGGYLWGYLRSKAINEAKWEVVTAELTAMKEQLNKMNGNVAKHSDWIVHHVESCHADR